jgi:hypothetical protein
MFIKFLRENYWTIADMTDSEWGTDENEIIVYGKMMDNHLSNTKGVEIHPLGSVCIGYWTKYGGMTRPIIFCSANEFGIKKW